MQPSGTVVPPCLRINFPAAAGVDGGRHAAGDPSRHAREIASSCYALFREGRADAVFFCFTGSYIIAGGMGDTLRSRAFGVSRYQAPAAGKQASNVRFFQLKGRL